MKQFKRRRGSHQRDWSRTDQGSPLVTTYAYNPDTGELTGIDYSDATPDITFTYDRLGRQKTITDAVGTHTFVYNNSLQPESETTTGIYDRVLTRTYETSGVTGRPIGFTLGADYNVTYGYETATGRFASAGWNAGGTTGTATYSYVPNSNLLSQLSTDTGLLTTYSYEPKRNLRTQIRNEYNSNLISQYDYIYNELGGRTSVQNSGQAFLGSAFNLYNYNDRNELTESARYIGADISDTTNPVEPEYRSYNYDPIGNRKDTADWDKAGAVQSNLTYTSNQLNQYDLITNDIGQPADSLAYDTDGNLTSISDGTSTTQYTYNAENRLISVELDTPLDGDTKVEFTYDYMGRRVKKDVYSYLAGNWELNAESLFLYDGWNLVEEQSGSGQPSANKYYIWGLDLSQSLQGAGGIGGLVASIDDTSAYQYAYDGNGNVGQLINTSDASIAAHYEYDPYGNELVATGPEAQNNVYRFSTKYFDDETDLYYYGFRYYSASLGRWLSRDPIGEDGGLNYYAYVKNNVANLID
ncbi:MAG TPA: RHS repeat-associated core domain-containing protein, partial [Nitrospirae bacterium]|nr:RHS repeat-associated core domain-containing protein [Nitrospirota bacterium]